jgi:peptidyl-prolyl cis-trans isomerase D
MLGSMRANKKNQTVIWIILGLLALGLIGFGGIGADGGSIRSIGKVGNAEISVDTYAQALNTAISNLSQQMGRTVTADEAQSFGIQNNVLQGLMITAALDNEAENLGISIGDEVVREQLFANRAFQGLDGNFDEESYIFALERSRLTPSEYDDILRKEAARGILQSSVIAGVKSQGTQTMALLAFDRETRDFTWAELTEAALDAPIQNPMDAQIQSQYEATPDAYTAPLTREITFVWLNPDMLADQVNIDEALIKESYDLQSDRFNKPEKRSLERIVFGTIEEATTARNMLDGGTVTFDTLLADRGLTPADVALGDVVRGGIHKDAADIVFAAEDTGIIGPVTSSLGPALFRINAILNADITSFENARAEIAGELSGEAARRLVSDLIADIDDMLAAGATIEELAADTDMELGTISFFAGTTTGIAAYDNFRTVASAAQKTDFPEVNELADGGIFALRVDAIKQPTLRPLTDVKDQVTEDWMRAETLRQLTIKAESLKLDIDAGASFGSLQTSDEIAVRRAGYIESTPTDMLTKVFQLSTGKTAIATGTNSVFIARLNQVNTFDAETSENKTLATLVQQQLDTQVANDLLNAFSNALRDDAEVIINQQAITQINSQLTGGY